MTAVEAGDNKPPCTVCSQFSKWSHKQSQENKPHSNQPPPQSNSSQQDQPSARATTTTPAKEEEIMDCPPDSLKLGRHTWTFLHTMAAYYPEQPSVDQQKSARQLIESLAQLYPCSWCARHLREYLPQPEHAVKVGSRQELERWMCDMHNEVNGRLGKPLFPCDRVGERWRDGPSEGHDCRPHDL